MSEYKVKDKVKLKVRIKYELGMFVIWLMCTFNRITVDEYWTHKVRLDKEKHLTVWTYGEVINPKYFKQQGGKVRCRNLKGTDDLYYFDTVTGTWCKMGSGYIDDFYPEGYIGGVGVAVDEDGEVIILDSKGNGKAGD